MPSKYTVWNPKTKSVDEWSTGVLTSQTDGYPIFTDLVLEDNVVAKIKLKGGYKSNCCSVGIVVASDTEQLNLNRKFESNPACFGFDLDTRSTYAGGRIVHNGRRLGLERIQTPKVIKLYKIGNTLTAKAGKEDLGCICMHIPDHYTKCGISVATLTGNSHISLLSISAMPPKKKHRKVLSWLHSTDERLILAGANAFPSVPKANRKSSLPFFFKVLEGLDPKNISEAKLQTATVVLSVANELTESERAPYLDMLGKIACDSTQGQIFRASLRCITYFSSQEIHKIFWDNSQQYCVGNNSSVTPLSARSFLKGATVVLRGGVDKSFRTAIHKLSTTYIEVQHELASTEPDQLIDTINKLNSSGQTHQIINIISNIINDPYFTIFNDHMTNLHTLLQNTGRTAGAKQQGSEFDDLVDHALSVKGRLLDFLRSLHKVAGLVKCLDERMIKDDLRILEQALLKTKVAVPDFSQVTDWVRGGLTCQDMDKMMHAMEAIVSCDVDLMRQNATLVQPRMEGLNDTITVVGFENCCRTPALSGLMYTAVYFHFADDPNKHIVEIKLFSDTMYTTMHKRTAEQRHLSLQTIELLLKSIGKESQIVKPDWLSGASQGSSVFTADAIDPQALPSQQQQLQSQQQPQQQQGSVTAEQIHEARRHVERIERILANDRNLILAMKIQSVAQDSRIRQLREYLQRLDQLQSQPHSHSGPM